MKWKIKARGNDRCIVSDCGQYQISRFTLGGQDMFLIYHQSSEIGDAKDGNAARKVAMRHQAHAGKESAKQAIGGEA
jgi:hypothetical protein